jgi:hypothetical protein
VLTVHNKKGEIVKTVIFLSSKVHVAGRHPTQIVVPPSPLREEKVRTHKKSLRLKAGVTIGDLHHKADISIIS